MASEAMASSNEIQQTGPPQSGPIREGSTPAHEADLDPPRFQGEHSLPWQVDEYRLTRVLGTGGMGQVYLAHDVLLERDVAIKLMTRSGRISRERFAVEARAAARLHHPNIVAVYRVGFLDGLPYIASEYVRGQTLGDMATPVSRRRALELGIAIARGLAAAHRQGVLHRDIKPDNVIVDDMGEPKITDFGLAKLLDPAAPPPAPERDEVAVDDIATDDTLPPAAPIAAHVPVALFPEITDKVQPDITPYVPPDVTPGGPSGDPPPDDVPVAVPPDVTDKVSTPLPIAVDDTLRPDAPDIDPPPSRERSHLTHEGALLGTPYYMSPEIWLGESATLRSDVYSLGALLYELCTGRVPHEDVPPDDLALTAIVEDPPPLRDFNPDIDTAFAAVIERCLDRDPDQRFASGETLLDALTALHSSSRVVEIPPGGPYRGLLPFEAEHYGLFFGRDSDIRDVIDRLRTQPVVVVTGESGVGKSSLARAGVAPWVVEHGLSDGRAWHSVTVIPGSHPLTALANELARQTGLDENELIDQLQDNIAAASQSIRQAQGNDRGVLLIVDQLEELVTLAEPEEAALASKAMVGLAQRTPGLRLVATVRGDKLTELAQFSGLGREIERALFILRPLDEEHIRETIIGPAAAAGVEFESDAAVTELVRCTTEASAGLPLLQFALDELWHSRDRERQVIPDHALDELGGVAGALSRHADSVLETLLPELRHAARKIMLQLVTLHGTRARLGEVALTGETRGEAGGESTGESPGSAALRALVTGRLVVVRDVDGESTYTIAHESLITHWATLRCWLDDEGSARAIHQRLALAAETWERMDRTRGALWSDRLLRQAETLDVAELSGLEAAFVTASQREETRGRRWRSLLSIAAFLVLAVGMVVVLQLKSQSDQQRQLAEKLALESSDNEARARAAEVEAEQRMLELYIEQGRQNLLGGDPMRAFVYLVEALDNGADDPATHFMLARAIDGLDGQEMVLPAHDVLVMWAQFSPDASRIATAGADGIAKLWDASTGALLSTLRGHKDTVYMLDFSPDGHHVATASWDHTLRVWDASTGDPLWTQTHEARVQWIGYTPDGARVVTASRDASARIWDARTGALLTTLTGHPQRITVADLDPRGEYVVTGSSDGSVRVWQLATGALLRTLESEHGLVRDVQISPDGARTAIAFKDGSARIAPLRGGPIVTLSGHSQEIWRIRFSPDSQQVVTASEDMLAKVWDVATGARLFDLAGHTSGVTHAAFHPDGQTIVTTSRDGTVRTWDARRRTPIWTFLGHERGAWRADFDGAGDRMVTAGFDGTARVWNARKTPYRQALDDHEHTVLSATPSPAGDRIATAQQDGTIQVWSRAGERLRVFQAGPGQGRVEWSPDGERLLVSKGYEAPARPGGEEVSVWNARSGEKLLAITGHSGETISHAAYDPQNTRIVTAGEDGVATIRDAATGRPVIELTGHDSAVLFAEFDSTGTRVLTSGKDNTARIWQAQSGALLQTLIGHELQVNAARFSADGSSVVTAGDDNLVYAWTAENGAMTAALEGHRSSALSAVFSDDGHLIATAASDGTARVWDAWTGELLWSIDHHTQRVWSIERIGPDLEILTASQRRAAIWRLSYGGISPEALSILARCRVPYELDGGSIERTSIPHETCHHHREFLSGRVRLAPKIDNADAAE